MGLAKTNSMKAREKAPETSRTSLEQHRMIEPTVSGAFDDFHAARRRFLPLVGLSQVRAFHIALLGAENLPDILCPMDVFRTPSAFDIIVASIDRQNFHQFTIGFQRQFRIGDIQ